MKAKRGFILLYSVVATGVIALLASAIVASNGALAASYKRLERGSRTRVRCEAVCEYFACGDYETVSELCLRYGYNVDVKEGESEEAVLSIYENGGLLYVAKKSGERITSKEFAS